MNRAGERERHDGVRATGVVRRRWDVWLSRAAKNGEVYVLYKAKNIFFALNKYQLTQQNKRIYNK
jgi:hypothetical protein